MVHEPQAGRFEPRHVDGLYDQRRLVARVLRHWTELATARGLPGLHDVDPWMIGDDWMHCLVVAVQSPVARSRLLTVGDNLLAQSSRALDGAAIGLCPGDTLAGVLVSHLPQMLPARRCVVIEGAAVHRGAVVLYRGALLPLSENGIDIEHVLGAANHRLLRTGEVADAVVRFTWAEAGHSSPGPGL